MLQNDWGSKIEMTKNWLIAASVWKGWRPDLLSFSQIKMKSISETWREPRPLFRKTGDPALNWWIVTLGPMSGPQSITVNFETAALIWWLLTEYWFRPPIFEFLINVHNKIDIHVLIPALFNFAEANFYVPNWLKMYLFANLVHWVCIIGT